MLNFQVDKQQTTSKQGNEEIYDIPLDAMGPNQNIQTNSNNYITLEFLPSIVLSGTENLITLNFDKLKKIDQLNDPIVLYLQMNTLVKDIGKESVNGAVSWSIWDSVVGN